MFNYIGAECYRIIRKKTVYIYLGVLIGCMLFGVYLASSNMSLQSIKPVAMVCFTLFGTAASAYLLSVVHGDDLRAKTLVSVIGFGNERAVIVGVKLFLLAILTILTYGAAMLGYVLLLFALGFQLTASIIMGVFEVVLITALKGIAVSSIASVIAYAFQRTSLAIVVFVLVDVGFFAQIIGYLLTRFKLEELSKYSINAILNELMKAVRVETVLPYIIYLSLFTLIAMFAFKQKDLDF